MESAVAVDIQLTPRKRVDVINVTDRLVDRFGEHLSARYAKALYYSYHTTAGYFHRSFCARLNHDRDSLRSYVESFQRLFPPGADYRHDQLQLRSELSEEQRGQEPLNADSHLTFIGAGLTNCVTYPTQKDAPVYFVDLDGVYHDTTRRRQTTVIGFSREEVAATATLNIPVSSHPIDSVSLKNARLGVFEQLQELVEHHEIAKGRIDLRLAPSERNTGLTVNEYETLLMQHDLVEVLKNPFRFMAEKGRNMLHDPRAIPTKARDYAKYDLVQMVNEFLDALGLSESMLERVIDHFLAVPAARALRMKRSVNLLVCDQQEEGRGAIVQGAYQSPILVQWSRAKAQTRQITATLVRFR